MRFRPEQYDAILRTLVVGTDERPGSLNLLVPWWLMAAHAYYDLDDPFLTDAGFDWCTTELASRWDEIEHVHKHLIDRDALMAGTGYHLAGKMPLRIQNATKALMFAYSRPDEIAPRPAVAIDDLLGGTPAADIDDLLGTVGPPSISNMLGEGWIEDLL